MQLQIAYKTWIAMEALAPSFPARDTCVQLNVDSGSDGQLLGKSHVHMGHVYRQTSSQSANRHIQVLYSSYRMIISVPVHAIFIYLKKTAENSFKDFIYKKVFISV